MEYKGEVEVNWDLGLHIRPAAEIVKLLQKFSCNVKLSKGGTSCSARSVMQLITLDAHKGAKLEILAKGEDAKEAVFAIQDFFAKYRDDFEINGMVF